MKKLLTLTSLATVATLSMSTLTFANSPQKPEDVNTVTAVTPSIVVDRDTLEELVPIRQLAEAHDFEVDWDSETKTTTLSKGENYYTSTIGSTTYNINGRETILETPSKLIDGITYVPVTYVQLVNDDMDSFDLTGDVDSDYTINPDTETDVNVDFDYNNPDIDSGFGIDVNTDVNTDGTIDYTTLPAEIN